MNGSKLNYGFYKDDNMTDEEMWDTFNWLFSSYSRNTSSYKFIFLKSIIDNINNTSYSGKLSFDSLFDSFTRISWNLVLKYHICQSGKVVDGRRTKLEQILNEYNNGEYVAFEELDGHEKRRIVNLIKKNCKTYVVGALYGDMDGRIYSFSKKEEWIQFNPQMQKFIKKNANIIENLNYYKWASYYATINEPDIEDNLKSIIDKSFIRKGEDIYRAMLAYEFERMPEIDNERVNTLELLFEAEQIAEKCSDGYDEVMVEEEMYRDMDHLKEYLSNPILLLKYIQREKVK